MKIAENRFDPAPLSPEELDQLDSLIIEEERPALVGREGVRLPLPDPIFHLLVRVIRMMRAGQAVVLFPEDETCTTQAAASFLGMSRQFFVGLLEKGELPFHRVGAHRRVYFKDLLEYQKRRNKERHGALDNLFRAVDEAGLYDKPTHSEDEKS